jgi:hypothetical protein
MIGFLKNRTLNKAAAREAASAPAALVLPLAEPDGRERRAQVKEETARIETALASESVAAVDRYEIRENADGWSVYDNQTVGTAEVYAYRLTRMNRPRAESLVAVLNRGEIRRRGRNG